MVSVELLIQQIINGLFFGGQLALIAVGLTLIWGVARVLNFAHGAMFMVGGYAGLLSWQLVGNAFVAISTAVAVTFVLGWVTESVLIEPLRGREEFDLATIVITLGFAIFLENSILVGVGSQRRAFPALTNTVWDVAGFTIRGQQFLLFLISIVALTGLFLFINRTKMGLAIRAVSQDSDTALLMGIRPERIYAVTFGSGAALAGLAGVLLAPLFTVYPAVGWSPFLLAFIVVMVGGLGSVEGTLIAAVVLAIIRSVSQIWVSTEAALAILFTIMIGTLVVAPNGIGGWIDS